MSRFFAQLLFSIVLGVGAVVGFRSDVRGRAEVNQALPDTKVLLQEKANVDLQATGAVKTQVNTAVSLSAREITRISARVNLRAVAKAKGASNAQVNSNTQLDTGGAVITNSIPEVSLNGASNTNSQTDLGADVQDLDVDLKNKLKSTLDLDLNLK